jgi:LPS-assembly protein
MPILKRASHKLTLAITAALLSHHQMALAELNDWDCRQINGSWDCSDSSGPIMNTSKDASIDDNIQTDMGTDASIPAIGPKAIVATVTAEPETSTQASSTKTEAAPNDSVLNNPAPKASVPDIESNPGEKPVVKTLTSKTPKQSETAATDIPYKATLPLSPYAHLNWYPYPKGKSPNICSGRYIEPELPVNNNGTPFQFQPIVIDASEARTQLGQGTELTGSVKVVQGTRSLYSSSAIINQETGQIDLKGGATYREPGLLFTGKTAQTNTNSKKTTLNDAEYVLYEKNIRGSVAQIARNEDATITIKEGTYTQCPPDKDSWKVSAKEIHLDQESGFGWAKHATLRVADIPVLYVPYFYFPIDDRRHSGFLYPSISYSDTEGFDISTPYYFNIAPNMDDTLTPRFLEKRGLLLENEFRYMDSHSTNTLNTSFLPSDSLTDKDRWLLGVMHTGTPSERWRTNIDYLKVSDDNYFDDLGTQLSVTEESHLNQSGSLNYYGNQWQAELLLQSYQTIDDNTTPYRSLPQLQISGNPTLEPDWLTAGYLVSLTQFDRDLTGLTDEDRIIGSRFHMEPELTASFRSTSGYIKPGIKLWYSQYQLDNQLDDLNDSPSISVPVVSIDSGLYFDRDFTLADNTYQQTLEPRLYGLYVPYQDQSAIPDFDTTEYNFSYASLFRNNRYSGYDRIGDTKQISLGITTRLIDSKGREAITASIGQAIYFDDRDVTIDNDTAADTSDFSDIATSVSWRPNTRMNVTFNANFDHEDTRNTENNLAVRYQEDINRIVNLSYRFSEDVRDQSTASFIWPVSKHWSALGVWQYDWLNSDNLDTAIGIEYESCCWKTRLITRQWLQDTDEQDTAIYLQFVLKGLGSFGSSGGSDFAEKITGFEQREETNDQF